MRASSKIREGRIVKLTAEQIEEARLLYAGNSLTNIEIDKRFGKGPNWINGLVTRFGWPLRGSHWRPGMDHGAKPVRLPGTKTSGRGTSKTAGRSLVQIIKDQRAEEAARQQALYGADLADIEYLRRRDFIINRERDRIRCDNDLITFAQMREKAARERRLEASAALVAANRQHISGVAR